MQAGSVSWRRPESNATVPVVQGASRFRPASFVRVPPAPVTTDHRKRNTPAPTSTDPGTRNRNIETGWFQNSVTSSTARPEAIRSPDTWRRPANPSRKPGIRSRLSVPTRDSTSGTGPVCRPRESDCGTSGMTSCLPPSASETGYGQHAPRTSGRRRDTSDTRDS